MGAVIVPLMKPLMKPLMRSLRTAFSPLSLFANGEQGALLDLVPSTYLYQDLAGTTPVVADGDLVALAQDLSPNGNDFTQSTTADRPEWTANAGGLMGLAAIDGGDSMVATAGSAIGSFTAVARITAPSGQGFIVGVGESPTNRVLVYLDAALRLRVSSIVSGAGSQGSALVGPTLDAGSVYTVVFTMNSVTGEMTVALYGGTTYSVTGDSGFSSSGMFLGGENDASFPFLAPMHRVVIVDKLLTPEELEIAVNFVENGL